MAWLLGKGFLHKVGTTTSRTSLFALQPKREDSTEAEPEAQQNDEDLTTKDRQPVSAGGVVPQLREHVAEGEPGRSDPLLE